MVLFDGSCGAIEVLVCSSDASKHLAVTLPVSSRVREKNSSWEGQVARPVRDFYRGKREEDVSIQP